MLTIHGARQPLRNQFLHVSTFHKKFYRSRACLLALVELDQRLVQLVLQHAHLPQHGVGRLGVGHLVREVGRLLQLSRIVLHVVDLVRVKSPVCV